MNPEDIERIRDSIILKRAFRIGSRGCSFAAQYFNDEWHLYIERAELCMTADILRLDCGEKTCRLIGRKRNEAFVFGLDLEEYIKFTDMSFIRVVKE